MSNLYKRNGNKIYFGSYYKDLKCQNKEPVEWDILEEKDGMALIISHYILDCVKFDNKSNNYEKSFIRKWLNNDFYNTAFDDNEKAIIETTNVDNSVQSVIEATDNEDYSVDGFDEFKNSNDKIFLLSIKEATTYFTTELERTTEGTNYADLKGLSFDLGGYSWWLRSFSFGARREGTGVINGNICHDLFVNNTGVGVRPACWIKLCVKKENENKLTNDVSQNASIRTDNNIKSNGENNNKIFFGSYPQSIVNDNNLMIKLNELAGKLPTEVNKNDWHDYNYYIKGQKTNYMYYKDVEIDNIKYRGVYFTQYRPVVYLSDSLESATMQIENGYTKCKIYWFSYDQIEWDILKEANGKALIISNSILDAQEYYPANFEAQFNHNGGDGYANNYELSNVRKFINETFYTTAFNDLHRALIENTNADNSVESLETNMTIYKCNDTNDKLFLLSYQEAGATYYLTSTKRKAKGSDYAKCQGLFGNSSTGYDNWWLRSPNWRDAKEVYYVMDNGHIDHVNVMITANGIRPACWIKLRGEKENNN